MEQQRPTAKEVRANPAQYITYEQWKRWGPPKWEGCLLAWFLLQLKDRAHLDLIRYVRVHSKEKPGTYLYYSFAIDDLLRETSSDGYMVEAFRNLRRLDRFEMSDGCFYLFRSTDHEIYEDALEYHEPISSYPEVEDRFGKLLS